ncbi:MAG: hypothetical protein R3F43_23520 [bacterium]
MTARCSSCSTASSSPAPPSMPATAAAWPPTASSPCCLPRATASSTLTHVQLAADVSAILDWAVAGLPGVDAARIGALGHSRGGKQVILAAIRDARIRAVFGLDPKDAPPFSWIPSPTRASPRS